MNAALYIRRSNDQVGVANDAKSVTRQIEHATAYARSKGWTVTQEHVFIDDGISGAEFAHRPGFARLMNSLRPKPRFQVLVMSEESRLGREAIEVAYAMKQIVTAGGRVFLYLEDRERVLDSPVDKVMLSLTAFSDELERERARQRMQDSMKRRAKAGHVCGGSCFGYQNVTISDATGRRMHVERRIDDDQAAVVRDIFTMFADGAGVRAIAKRLNDGGRPAPRPRDGRPKGWTGSSVREILHRRLYIGEAVYNQTRKKNQWGARAFAQRPESEWITASVPELRIVPDALWQLAQQRAATKRANYLRSTQSAVFGRPANPFESPYLLTGFIRCAECGSSLVVQHRGPLRSRQYVCTSCHHRGRAVCTNTLESRMDVADDAILTDLEQFILQPTVVQGAIAAALDALNPSADAVDQERARLDTSSLSSAPKSATWRGRSPSAATFLHSCGSCATPMPVGRQSSPRSPS